MSKACPRSFILRGLALSVAIACLPSAPLAQADWPQWRGPNRDGVSQETGLLQEWPEEGPPQEWLFKDCGIGYAGPAIVGNRLYIMGSRDGIEKLLALDVQTGQEVWQLDLGEEYENDWGNGPRATPTVDPAGLIYTIGGQGTIMCADAKTGKKVWSRTMQEFGGKIPVWGYSESPLIVGDRLFCTPGDQDKQGPGAMVALDKATGKLLWQSKKTHATAHYSSPVHVTRFGKSEVVQLLVNKLVGIDAETGKQLWKKQWPGRVAVVPTPITRDRFVYISSGYGVGSALVEVKEGYEIDVKHENRVMANHHGGVILLGDHLYGYSEKKGWVCQDFFTGEYAWRERKALGKGAIAYADNRFYCLEKESGKVALIDASPEDWKEHGRFQLSPLTELRKEKGRIWMHPVICDGKLYLRDQELLFCFNLKDPKAEQVAQHATAAATSGN